MISLWNTSRRIPNSQLPTFFKVAATWGGHEGSILFWLFTLSLWLVAFAFFSRKNDRTFSAQTLSLLGLICLGFAIFILFYPIHLDVHSLPCGRERDLNPMLQDIGLIFHPPLLYVGYVGFAVNFAMSISALIFNRSAQAIARAMRAGARFLVILNLRDRSRCMVGILRIRLGWLVVLGPC